MKCQKLFSGKNINLLPAELTQRVVKVTTGKKNASSYPT